MRIGSLFSGIGGLELGLERATGGRVVWQVEKEPFPREVLAKHWPNADRSVTDVREASASNLEPVELICGGFPCQDISLAGKGAGLAGERSGLWREFARLVGELGPRFVVVENVSALVVRGLDAVLGDLAALGFDAEWTTLRAADVGAPHRRERLFVVAWRVSDAERNGVRQEPRRRGGKRNWRPAPIAADVGAKLADSNSGRREGERERGLLDGQPGDDTDGRHGAPWPPGPHDLHAWRGLQTGTQPSICRVADGLPPWMARRREKLKALGNAVVPQVAEIVGRRVAELAGGLS